MRYVDKTFVAHYFSILQCNDLNRATRGFLTNERKSAPTAKGNLGLNFIDIENHKVKFFVNESVSDWLKKVRKTPVKVVAL